MAQALQELPPAIETWMVGDTEADIVAAQTYGVKVMAVLSGIRDRAQLERYQPNLIVNNLSEAVEVILDQFWQQTGHMSIA
ncbi:MAG: HAD hydrolase-like protein [Trichocoleus desertorum ATA4-8-CV12]|jgi:phosphoglycolate phosphatase-like HAD superfamily hydrolase|nr:HAD hydrolase-like protein [Trichocoleus desertorum ATA4-8-CV12]